MTTFSFTSSVLCCHRSPSQNLKQQCPSLHLTAFACPHLFAVLLLPSMLQTAVFPALARLVSHLDNLDDLYMIYMPCVSGLDQHNAFKAAALSYSLPALSWSGGAGLDHVKGHQGCPGLAVQGSRPSKKQSCCSQLEWIHMLPLAKE